MSQSLSKTPATPPASSGAASPPPAKAPSPLMTRLLARPEIGALIAAVVIYIFFFLVAPAFRSAEAFSTILYASSLIGIVAVGVGLLMIGGEFDLSAGVAVVTYALTAAMLDYQFNFNIWVGVLLAVILALFIGFINGYLVVKTGIPSFLITLGTFFVLQGANLGITKLVTGAVSTQNVSDMQGFDSAEGGVRVVVRHLRGDREDHRGPPGPTPGHDAHAGAHLAALLRRTTRETDEYGRCGAEHRHTFVADEREGARRLDAAQTDVRATHGGDDPDEGPAVRVEHRQGPEVAVRGCHVEMDDRPTAFMYALRCVIITPFGRKVVPLV